MYEIVILGEKENTTWKRGSRPETLEEYLKPGVFMVALYVAGDMFFEPKLLDYIYRGDQV